MRQSVFQTVYMRQFFEQRRRKSIKDEIVVAEETPTSSGKLWFDARAWKRVKLTSLKNDSI